MEREEEERLAKETCMCGSPMEGHSVYDNHQPLSMFDYYCRNQEESE